LNLSITYAKTWLTIGTPTNNILSIEKNIVNKQPKFGDDPRLLEREGHPATLVQITDKHNVMNFGAKFIHSFIHPGYYYSLSSSPLLLRGTPGTAQILCRSFTPKCHRQLRMKDLPKVLTWWLELYSNPWPFGRKAPNLPMSHQAPQIWVYLIQN